MYNTELFLGWPTPISSLESIDSELAALLIGENALYLQKIVHNDAYYLGKIVPNTTDLSQIELIEKNIYSLLGKLYPENLITSPLHLFPIPSQAD